MGGPKSRTAVDSRQGHHPRGTEEGERAGRKLIVAEFITVDGFIANSKGHVDVESEGMVDDGGQFQHELVRTQRHWGTLLMGRVTYQEICGSWAEVPIEGNPIASFMNTVPKVVVSRTLKEAPWGKWEPADIVSRGVEGEIARLKTERGKDLALLGSGRLARFLAQRGLVDEVLLHVFPVALGNGVPLFPGLDSRLSLRLLESRRLRSGVVVQRYQLVH
jgi:dihydrofolate reductase